MKARAFIFAPFMKILPGKTNCDPGPKKASRARGGKNFSGPRVSGLSAPGAPTNKVDNDPGGPAWGSPSFFRLFGLVFGPGGPRPNERGGPFPPGARGPRGGLHRDKGKTGAAFAARGLFSPLSRQNIGKGGAALPGGLFGAPQGRGTPTDKGRCSWGQARHPHFPPRCFKGGK